MRKALQPSGFHAAPATQGARLAAEEGNLPTLLRLVRESERGTFAPCVSTHDTHTATASPVLGATDDGLGTSPRTRRSRRAVAFDAPFPDSLALPGTSIDGAAWLAACFPSEEGELSHAARPRGRAGSGGQRNGTGGNALTPARARIGRSRSCSRVVVVAEVDRRCPAKTSGRSPFQPIWKRSWTVA
jgi:hypothetical protein